MITRGDGSPMITINDLDTPEKRSKLYRIPTRLEYPDKDFIAGDSGIIGQPVPVVGTIHSIFGEGDRIDDVVIISHLTRELYHADPSEVEAVE